MRAPGEGVCPSDETPESACDALSYELGTMTAGFTKTAQRLLPAMAQLILPGAPLPEPLLEELVEHRRHFDALRARVRELAGSLGLTSPPAESLTNLGQLDALLAAVAAAEARNAGHEVVRRQALKVLDRVRRIRHRTSPEDAALRSFRDAAHRLGTTIAAAPASGLPADTRLLAGGRHPLVSLLALIEGGNGISDSHWEELVEVVGAAFGKALAASAARGKLVITAEDSGGPALAVTSLKVLADRAPVASNEPKTSFGTTVSIPRPIPMRTPRPRVVNPSGLKVELG